MKVILLPRYSCLPLRIALAASFWAGTLAAAPPDVGDVTFNQPGIVNYQARLKSEQGEDYTNGLYGVEFRLYTQASGGTPIWGAAYQVYVREGYFGVMLGQPGGDDITNATYGANELWKALWYDEGDPQNNLFLGLTALQNEHNAPIALPKESVPRQQFLCTPFALRAQQAQYARESMGDFDVGGMLRVNGNALFRNPVTCDANAQFNTNATFSGPITIDSPATFNKSASFDAAASFSQSATFSGSAIFNAAATFNQALALNGDIVVGGAVKAGSGSDLSLQNDNASSYVKVKENGTAEVKGSTFNVLASQLTVNGKKPFLLYSRFMAIINESEGTMGTGISTAEYAAMVVGFDFFDGDIHESGVEDLWKMIVDGSGSHWIVKVRSPLHNLSSSSGASFGVHILFILKELVDDTRSWY